MTIIPSSRPFFTLGPRRDWWAERIMVLERSAKNHRALPVESVLPGVLPSMLGQSAIPELVGSSSASSSTVPAVPAPHPQHLSKKARKKQQVE